MAVRNGKTGKGYGFLPVGGKRGTRRCPEPVRPQNSSVRADCIWRAVPVGRPARITSKKASS